MGLKDKAKGFWKKVSDLDDDSESANGLSKEKERIPYKDISKKLGVRPPSVVDALKKLSEKGLINYEKYDRILLTEKGLEIAKETYQKHVLLMKFFTEILGIPPEIAEEDACQFEHYVHEITAERMKEFAHYIQEHCPYILKQFLKEHFTFYY